MARPIATGKLTLIVGDPGLGKTFLTLDISSRVSRGSQFPDGASCESGEVIFATVEDGAADTIRPRLDLLGADVSRVFHFEGIGGSKGEVQPFLLDRHISQLDAALSEHDNVRLVVFDPISGFMGATDSHKNAEVRGTLSPLAKLADKHNVAVVAISHLTKSQGKSIYRAIGSIAFVAAARAAWAVVEDQHNDRRRLFLPIKNNLADATGLAFEIVDGRVEWDPEPIIVRIDDLDDRQQAPRLMPNSGFKPTSRTGPRKPLPSTPQRKPPAFGNAHWIGPRRSCVFVNEVRRQVGLGFARQ